MYCDDGVDECRCAKSPVILMEAHPKEEKLKGAAFVANEAFVDEANRLRIAVMPGSDARTYHIAVEPIKAGCGRPAGPATILLFRPRVIMRLLAALLTSVLAFSQAPARPSESNDLAVWREFSTLVRKGNFPPDRLKPLVPGMENDLLTFLAIFREADAASWERVPEVVRNGPAINFIIPFGDESRPFNFILVEDGGRWFFRHLEQVMIRLDKTPAPPTSEFPDTSEERKAWARDEVYWSQVVFWHTALVPKIGKPAFLDLLRDGSGYAVGAQTWVPFVPPARAFVLYLCWDLARLHGMNTRGRCVVLESLDDRAAAVRLRDHPFFRLYKDATHIRPKIAFADYREIFETIWVDRARATGWTLAIDYLSPDGLEILFRFTRSGGSVPAAQR
jgi:hypothetical protein